MCDVSLDLYVGEVLGIVGLVGLGCIELLCLIYGVDCVDKGSVELLDKEG